MIDPLELHAYADGELDALDRERISQELNACAESRAELATIERLKQTLSNHAGPVECRAEWKACLSRLDELDKTRRTESFVTRYAWAICGVFFLFILAGGIATRLSPNGSMQSPDLARAVASLGSVSRPQSQQPAHVRRWLDSLLGEASDLVAPQQMIVTNAATGVMDGYRVTQVGLRDDKGDLALLVVNAQLDLSSMPVSTDPEFRAGKLQGVNCLAWKQGRYTFVFAGERSYGGLIDATKKAVRVSR